MYVTPDISGVEIKILGAAAQRCSRLAQRSKFLAQGRSRWLGGGLWRTKKKSLGVPLRHKMCARTITLNRPFCSLYKVNDHSQIFLLPLCLLHLSIYLFKSRHLITLREEIFAGINFRELGFTQDFAGINFRELSLTKDFTGINFHESALFKQFAGVNLTFALGNLFSTTLVYGFEINLNTLINTFLLIKMTK